MVQTIDNLHILSMEMKKSGYSIIKYFVLKDMEDEDKEHIQCGHI